jgi:hypothetical protein
MFHNDGSCRLGDRHILELGGKGARLTAVDAKICPDRTFVGVDSPQWVLHGAAVVPFASAWGAPYGAHQAVVGAGNAVEIDVVCTDVSVAYADTADGGDLRVLVDGVEKLLQPSNAAFVDIEGRAQFMENRKGILGLGFGLHTVRVEAVRADVAVLGIFAYDARSNRAMERRLVGHAVPGEKLAFSLPFRARPVVLAHGGPEARPEDVTRTGVVFSGRAAGMYEIVGE